jgi:antagonist of KipI
MSLRILKAGILDTIQDLGRYGYQHLGINPTGAMDKFAASIANALAGNKADEAVIELHFPASVFLFDQPAIIALAGADFNASINGEPVPVNQPLIVNKTSVLQFHSIKNKARCYLAVRGGFRICKWLSSYSTNLKAEAGGLEGSKLKKDDVIELNSKIDLSEILAEDDFKIMPWKANETRETNESKEIFILPGNEWNWLDPASQKKFLSGSFTISNNSDRMGYRMKGEALQTITKEELVSSAICFGAIQLLPDGHLIILMADHQTTGGYPRMGNVITAHLPKLAQMKAGDKIHFAITAQKNAEELMINQQQHLLQLKNACIFRLEKYIYENN